MSVLPCHVPTSVFSRSNSGDPCFGLSDSPAVSHSEVASSNDAQTGVNFVFMVFLSLLVFGCLSEFHQYNERTGAFRTVRFGSFGRNWRKKLLSGNEAVVVWLALFAHEPLVGFLPIITGEFFLVGIPLQGLLHTDGDDAKMGYRDGTVADFHIADRVFAAADRLEEIAHVVAALVELDGAFQQRILK